MKTIASLSAVYLLLLSGSSQAAIVSQICTDNYDDALGYIVGQTCNTTSSYQLSGTLTIHNPLFGDTYSPSNISATLTQDSFYVEDYYNFSALEDIKTYLTISMPELNSTYTMEQHAQVSDWDTTFVYYMNEMMSENSNLTPDGQTLWSISENGIFATLNTLDSDGDGFNGINFYLDGGPLLFNIGNVELHTVPVPAAVWLFSSGLLMLFGVSRRRT